MQELRKRLQEGKHSCVIANGSDIRIFCRRGVADIYDILKNDPKFLQGASIADKVIGKAAAALLILGGIKQVYSNIISQLAMELFQSAHVEVTYGKLVPHIINRTHTGWCPLETLSKDAQTPEDVLVIVENFMMQEVQSDKNVQWYIFFNDRLLLKKAPDGTYSIPQSSYPPFPTDGHTVHDVFLNNGQRIKTFSVDDPIEDVSGWEMIGLRASFAHITHAEYRAAGKAYQILYWDVHSRYCSVCGANMEQKTPIMKKCPKCGNEMYPPVSTAIIVLVRKGDEILLVHARNFRGTFYGLVAGFLEAGETLEECVQREVMEETGLRIKNISYFSSQPWPYPSGLMVGFFADYESGEIKLQNDELSAGAFYSRNNLPELPQKLSIARRLIDWWLTHPEN